MITELVGISGWEAFAVDVHERLRVQSAVRAVTHKSTVPFLQTNYVVEVWDLAILPQCEPWGFYVSFNKVGAGPGVFRQGVPAVSGESHNWGPTGTSLLGKCN